VESSPPGADRVTGDPSINSFEGLGPDFTQAVTAERGEAAKELIPSSSSRFLGDMEGVPQAPPSRMPRKAEPRSTRAVHDLRTASRRLLSCSIASSTRRGKPRAAWPVRRSDPEPWVPFAISGKRELLPYRQGKSHRLRFEATALLSRQFGKSFRKWPMG